MTKPMTASDQHARLQKPLMAEMKWDPINQEWFAFCPYCSRPSAEIEQPGLYNCECGKIYEVYALEPVEE